jgi:hypothetical protein
MVNMSDELKESNILKLTLMVRFACATLDMGHPIIADMLLGLFVLRSFFYIQGFPPRHEHINIGRIKLHSSMAFI